MSRDYGHNHTDLFWGNLWICIGAGIIGLKLKKANKQLNNQCINSAQFSSAATEKQNLIEKYEKDLETLRIQCSKLEKDKTSLEEREKELKNRAESIETQIKERYQKSIEEFDLLSRKILDEKTKKFDEHSKIALNALISPLKEDITEFHKNIGDKYKENQEDRSSLKEQIFNFSKSTNSLTKILQGNSKAQGKWGELILEKILENSGLKKGVEFTVEDSYDGSAGNRIRPDVTLHLTNKKTIFIDAKVSLILIEINKITVLPRFLKSLKKLVPVG